MARRIAHRAWSVALVGAWLCVSRAAGGEVDYTRDVRPLLKAKCYACHGPLRQEGGLRLDSGALVRQGGDGGKVVTPGDPAASSLVGRIASTDESERMPAEGQPLTAEQIEIFRAWIRQGAASPSDEPPPDDPRTHWAFQPLTPPHIADAAHGVSAIDALIVSRLNAAGLEPSPQADRRTLIRRLYLDLHGLPPEPAEVAAFVADDAPDAWARLVDKVLASPRYGERWAQHWLDVVRYADTHGYEVNTPREHAWPYRDWVIGAFNDDKPYDEFVFEQLAGDTVGADAATGFLVAAAVLLPGQIGADDASKRLARQDALDDILVGTGGTFLGLTIGCARCHDHKFDPLAQRDYYGLQAFFAGVEYDDRPVDDPAYRERLAQAEKLVPRIEELKSRLRAFDVLALFANNFAAVPDDLPPLVKELKRLEAESARLKKPTLVFAGKFRRPDMTHVLRRGDPEQPQETIGPRVPEVLGTLALPPDAPEAERRVALARWIASGENPLAARVMVNRVWQYHFGRGLVETASDFGLSGDRPSHPELLDYLAARFIEGGWSVKQLHRLIVASAAYRRSSRIDPAAQKQDADCRLAWRFVSRRLEAEAIRDAMLATSGQLNLHMGGPGFNFFRARGGLSGFPPIEKFGPNELRRMIYAHKIRMERVPVFGAFDCPDAGQSTPKRGQSTTAIQALNLFNGPFVVEQSEAFAARVRREAGEEIARQVDRAYLLAFGRTPDGTEAEACRAVVAEHGLPTLCRVIFNSNEFLFIP